MTKTTPSVERKSLIIEAMPRGGFIVREAQNYGAELLAASTIAEALSFIQQELCGEQQ